MYADTADTAIKAFYSIEEARRTLKEVLAHFNKAYGPTNRYVRSWDKETQQYEWLDCNQKLFYDKVNEFFPFAKKEGISIDQMSIKSYMEDCEGKYRQYSHPKTYYPNQWRAAEEARRDDHFYKIRLVKAKHVRDRPPEPPWLKQHPTRRAEIDRRRGNSAPPTVRAPRTDPPWMPANSQGIHPLPGTKKLPRQLGEPEVYEEGSRGASHAGSVMADTALQHKQRATNTPPDKEQKGGTADTAMPKSSSSSGQQAKPPPCGRWGPVIPPHL